MIHSLINVQLINDKFRLISNMESASGSTVNKSELYHKLNFTYTCMHLQDKHLGPSGHLCPHTDNNASLLWEISLTYGVTK